MNYESSIRKHKRKFLPIFGIGVIVFILAGYGVNKYVIAQNAGQGLEVSPPSQEVTIDPGKTTTITATLRNRSNNTLPINVHAEDFTAKGEEGQVELNADSPYSIASWTNISPDTFELGPGEEQEVTATIKAPSEAAGGRFGSFVFSVQPEKTTGNAAAVTQSIASLFLVRVTGPVDEKLNVKEFTAPNFSEFGPVPLAIKVENKGNVHVKTYGLINVTDMFGRKVADIVVPGVNVFPDADRIVRATLDKQFLIGKYTATALMYYGSVQTQSFSATTSFFVFPVRIAAVVIIILFLLYVLRKRLKKALKALFK